MREVEQEASRAYRDRFGEDPQTVTSAPGRINMIGEHTDYNEGFVLPCAIDRRVAVAASSTAGSDSSELYSVDFSDARPLADEEGSSWANYPRGVVWALEEAGHSVGPFRAAFRGDVPRGSGLSSSAAIEAATALAADALSGFGLERREAAILCRRAENGYVGVQSGIMDQYASLMCREGAALFIDCRTLEARPVPLDLEGEGLTLLVCDTRLKRSLTETGYNDRRASCERAAATLGIESLRDATKDDLAGLRGEELKRARHIVTENQRVLESVEALESGDYSDFGELMYASHVSMRDDYEISTPSHDAFVELARERGALGARLTGGGFGGCAIALVDSEGSEALVGETRDLFERERLGSPEFYEFLPAAGAEVHQLH